MSDATNLQLSDLPLEDSPFLLDAHGPLFVLGCPRSGSTFLSRCLAAFGGIEEFVGVLAPPRVMHLLACLDDPVVKTQIMLSLRDTFWNVFWRRRFFRGERLLQVLRGNLPWREFARRPTLAGAIFCYKENYMCFAAQEFAAHFPRAQFIHILRDGRDNADSLERTYPHALSDAVLQSEPMALNKASEIGTWDRIGGFCVPWWVPDEFKAKFGALSRYARNVLLWREMTERACALRASLGADRYVEIRYEDFMREPEVIGRRIGDFIGKPLTRVVARRLHRARATSIAISRRNQDAEKIAAANEIAGPLLGELGYLH